MKSTAIGWVALLCCIGAALTLAPLWASIVLGAWFAMLLRPLVGKLEGKLGGRSRAAMLATLALFVLIVGPIAFSATAVYAMTSDFIQHISASSGDLQSMLRSVVSSKPGSGEAGGSLWKQAAQLAQQYGGKAWAVFGKVAGVTGAAVIGIFVFLYATYVFLVDGRAFAVWLEERAPIPRAAVRRLGGAFEETGRGLLISTGLTALTQGVIATIAYLILGVPRALLLGFFTSLAALIPSVGTGLVWVPVAAGLALTGRTTAAIAMALIGVLVIGTVDNVVRPIFSRYGQLRMPTFLVFVSIIGGLAIFGMWGLILGPLTIRMSMEALDLMKESRSEAQ